jgi:hypothetical protein
MPSAKDCAEKLRELAYKTLLPQIRDLEEELKTVGSSIFIGVHRVERKLESLRQIELPTTELILEEILGEIIRQKNQETSQLACFARDVCKKETQEEILSFLLDEAQKYSPCLALLAARGDRLVGWSSRGCSDDLARTISSATFQRSECALLGDALNNESVVTISSLPETGCLKALQEVSLGQWRLFSLRVLQRPVALLLAGETEGRVCHSDALSLLVVCAALRLENVALKILNELVAAKPEAAVQQALVEKTVPGEPVAAPRRSKEIPVVPSVFTQKQETEPIPTEFMPIHQAEPVLAPISSFEKTDEGFDDRSSAQTQIPIAIPTLSPEIHKASLSEAPTVPEEEKLHTDAKRFARLLVSEIKLYNDQRVVEGRQDRDLYLRLKKDIDRSREMYEKRVSPKVAQKIDYFHDEIIRMLCDNDPSMLGSDYPGPRIES